MSSKLVICHNKEAEVAVKKSRFLGFAFYVDSQEKIGEILETFEDKYKGARHTVFAFRFEEKGVLREKFDNDAEPTGSAGKPLLYLLQKKEVINCLLVVVRYFGGIKLGVGGLIRAYTQAGQVVLENNLHPVPRELE